MLLFYPRKSYRHPALRESAVAHTVYDASAIFAAKLRIFRENLMNPHGKYTNFNKITPPAPPRQLIGGAGFGNVSWNLSDRQVPCHNIRYGRQYHVCYEHDRQQR